MDQRQQFRARFLRASAPSSAEGIEKYLGSGMIRGIGPIYAKKLVRAFSDKVFDIIEGDPARLREVAGIGPVRARRNTEAWAEQNQRPWTRIELYSKGSSLELLPDEHLEPGHKNCEAQRNHDSALPGRIHQASGLEKILARMILEKLGVADVAATERWRATSMILNNRRPRWLPT